MRFDFVHRLSSPGQRLTLATSAALAAAVALLSTSSIVQANPPERLYTCIDTTINCNDHWLENQASVIAQRPLNQVVIPGSHDSTQYRDTDGGDIFTSPRTRTQDLTIAQQLESGIRAFDVRIQPCLNASHGCTPGEYTAEHGGHETNESIGSVLDQFHDFTSTHPKEILIVAVATEGAQNDETLRSACSDFMSDFGGLLVPVSAVTPFEVLPDPVIAPGKVTTVQDIWNLDGPRVIADWSACLGVASSAAEASEWATYLNWPTPRSWGTDTFYAAQCLPYEYEELVGFPIYGLFPTYPGIVASVGAALTERKNAVETGTVKKFFFDVSLPTALGGHAPNFYTLSIAATESAGCAIPGPRELNLGTNNKAGSDFIGEYHEQVTLKHITRWWDLNEHRARAHLNIIIADFVEKLHLVSDAEHMNAGPTILPTATTSGGQELDSGDHTTAGTVQLRFRCLGASDDPSWYPERIRVDDLSTGRSAGANRPTTNPTSSLDLEFTLDKPAALPASVTLLATCLDTSGKLAQTSFVVTFDADAMAPTTTITLFPSSPNGENGWYRSVGVFVSAADEADGSGVAETRCLLDPASPPTSFDALPAACPYVGPGVTVFQRGEHTLYAASKDAAGNKGTPVSRRFKADSFIPVTVIRLIPASPNGANGWYRTAVDVSIEAEDGNDGSGVSETRCALDPAVAPNSFAGFPVGPCPASVGAEGEHALQAVSKDRAGNEGPVDTRSFKIDRTAPTVTYTSNAGSYALMSMVAITCTAADGLSGVASSTCADISGPAYTFGPGTSTFSASATDNAGNTGTGSTSFTVAVTQSQLCKLTTQLVKGSARYQALKPAQKALVDATAKAACAILDRIVPTLTARQKAVYVTSYKLAAQKLADGGWLTQAQATTLKTLADAL
jgi:hypothetical protein